MNNQISTFQSINGDSVVHFTSAKEMKLNGWADASRVAAYLMDDEGMSHKKNLGLVNLFATTHKRPLTTMRNLFTKSAVLEVTPFESVTYDLPVSREEHSCYTTHDTSGESDKPGIDGSFFTIYLSEEFTANDTLTYDPHDGEQLIVSDEHPVQPEGDSFKHTVRYLTNDKTKFFPSDQLKAGIKYMKITHVLGEYDTKYSGINLVKNPAGTITNEFILGDPRGVEVSYTGKAASMKSPGLTSFANDTIQKALKNLEMMGGKDSFFMANVMNKSFDESTMKVGKTIEYLALAELAQMEAYALVYSKAGRVPSGNGTKAVNEGLHHQRRRGKRIKYARPGGITHDKIHEAASYIYKNSPIEPMLRRIKFHCGTMAYANMQQLFRDEINQQLNGLPAGMLGNDNQFKGPLLTGPLNALEMQPVVFSAVTIPGIGKIELVLDESLDYLPLTDRFAAGFYGEGGMAWTSYSMVIEDATDPYYSNVDDKVKGASLVEGGSKMSNIYYIKPEGQNVIYGYEQGRMADDGKYTNIVSSLKYSGRNFWATSHSAALMLDITRYVCIELER
jgi:hypothetical protein